MTSRVLVIATVVAALPASAGSASTLTPHAEVTRSAAQPRPERACLHGENETAWETTRREEALGAMRLIYYVLETTSTSPQAFYPSWEELAKSPRVAELQGAQGVRGELARKIQWGASEPLAGWGISYVAYRAEARFALTDLRDPCGFTYSSFDPQVIPRSRARIVPLES